MPHPFVTIKSYCLRLSWFLASALTFAYILVLNFQEWCFSQAWNKADACFISNHLSETSDFTNLYEVHFICLFNSQVLSDSISEALPLSKCRCRELHAPCSLGCLCHGTEIKISSTEKPSRWALHQQRQTSHSPGHGCVGFCLFIWLFVWFWLFSVLLFPCRERNAIFKGRDEAFPSKKVSRALSWRMFLRGLLSFHGVSPASAGSRPPGLYDKPMKHFLLSRQLNYLAIRVHVCLIYLCAFWWEPHTD